MQKYYCYFSDTLGYTNIEYEILILPGTFADGSVTNLSSLCSPIGWNTRPPRDWTAAHRANTQRRKAVRLAVDECISFRYLQAALLICFLGTKCVKISSEEGGIVGWWARFLCLYSGWVPARARRRDREWWACALNVWHIIMHYACWWLPRITLPILAFKSGNALAPDIHLQGLFFDPCTQWLLRPTHAIWPFVVSFFQASRHTKQEKLSRYRHIVGLRHRDKATV